MNPARAVESESASKIGGRVRAARIRRGWSQRELADAAGLSRTTLVLLERGADHLPRAETIHRLASALRVDPEELLGPEFPGAEESSLSAVVAYDQATNPCVAAAIEAEPELFDGFRDADWQELTSTFGVGGALTEEGVLAVARAIRRKRDVLFRVEVLLETHLADATVAMIDSLYNLVKFPR